MTDPVKPDSGSSGELSGAERDAFRQRSQEIGRRLDELKERDAPAPDSGRGNALGLAFRMATDLVAGVLVGGAMGYFLDQWLGTKPFLMLVLGLLGLVAGLMNVLRLHRQMQAQAEKRYGPAHEMPGVPDDDD